MTEHLTALVAYQQEMPMCNRQCETRVRGRKNAKIPQGREALVGYGASYRM